MILEIITIVLAFFVVATVMVVVSRLLKHERRWGENP